MELEEKAEEVLETLWICTALRPMVVKERTAWLVVGQVWTKHCFYPILRLLANLILASPAIQRHQPFSAQSKKVG